MEIKVIENKKNKLLFEIVGEDHAFCNALKTELLNDSNVKIASYNVEHPLIGSPKMVVETSSGDAFKALTDAAKRLAKKV